MASILEEKGLNKETIGSWIVHHSRKILGDVNAPSEYSVLDEIGKATELLMRMGETGEVTLNKVELDAIAKSLKLNPRSELPHCISLLKKHDLIDSTKDMQNVHILGVTTRSVLSHAANMFEKEGPEKHEQAVILLSETASQSPVALNDAREYIGDELRIKNSDVNDIITQSVEIGFVDKEGDSTSDCLLFNGNIFRKDCIQKTERVLSSLSANEATALIRVREILTKQGCVSAIICEKELGKDLFEKLKSAGLLDISIVSNETGDNAFVTLPDAFHKFVNPIVDDTFDMAKALVSALTYGKESRDHSKGRIIKCDWILGKLVRGEEIGPATAIGYDYRVLEQSRVVKITHTDGKMFKMKLLKKEIGELALDVLSQGDANTESLKMIPSAPMVNYTGPEVSRERTRKTQSQPSKKQTHQIMMALRSNKSI